MTESIWKSCGIAEMRHGKFENTEEIGCLNIKQKRKHAKKFYLW